ncbi:hypothetical protein [Parapedobacter indicus]|nr:hypothetical protein [Parapedobacter indicus]
MDKSSLNLFYRVGHLYTKQGLWYDKHGNFTGLIHRKFKFCLNSDLQMPFDNDCVGWLSATKTLNELFNWFTLEDIQELQQHDFVVWEYMVSNWKQHNGHWLINQETSIAIERITL